MLTQLMFTINTYFTYKILDHINVLSNCNKPIELKIFAFFDSVDSLETGYDFSKVRKYFLCYVV